MATIKYYFLRSLRPPPPSVMRVLVLKDDILTRLEFEFEIERDSKKWHTQEELESAIKIEVGRSMLEQVFTTETSLPTKGIGDYYRLDEVSIIPGRYYPRIFRPVLHLNAGMFIRSPHREIQELQEHILEVRDYTPFHRDYLLAGVTQLSVLIEGLKSICRTIHPSEDNFKVYGSEIRNLFILACTEVEAQLAGIFAANVASKRDRLTMEDYVKLMPHLKLDQYGVHLNLYPRLGNFAPFYGWNQSKPTKSIRWYNDYHAVKHDRETEFTKSNMENLFNAVSAVAVLLAAQYGPFSVPYWSDLLGNFLTFSRVPLWDPEEYYVPPFVGHDWAEVKVLSSSSIYRNPRPKEGKKVARG